MKKTLFLLALAILGFGTLNAKPVDVAVAKSLGIKFMNCNTVVKSDKAQLVYTAQTDRGEACFYVFGLQPKGFVIVSADDRAKPILAYSTESNFTPNQIEGGLMTFFDNYKAGFAQMFANNEERTEQAVADWTRLAETGKINCEKIDRSVEPLMASIWNQTDLYNFMAPEDPNSAFSGHCKSGCVANAMSQVMRYWEWPRHGVGSHGYDASSYYGDYGWQEANFAEATYRFELMPDFLDFVSPEAEVDAVALLEYHAGVSVDMGYGASASGAYSEDVPNAFQSYFRYSSEMQLNYEYYGNQSTWENTLRDNLDAGMPLYYASSGPDGGHAYVMDGYDDNNMFHMNWGWAGFDNGYYAIDGFYLTYYSFPWYHCAIFNLHPDEEYYNAPKAVENLNTYVNFFEFAAIEFDPVFETLNGETLNSIDTIVVMRDDVIIERLVNVTDQHVMIGMDGLPEEGTYYYSVYAKNGDIMSKVVRDTLVLNHGSYYKFDLHDTHDDGWDMSFVAVLNEDGKVMGRAGLMNGGQDEVIMPVPCNKDLTLFWTYDNACYSHGTVDQCSFEVYDESDNLLFESPEVLTVGPLHSMYEPCYNPGPEYITAEYVYENDVCGVLVSWAGIYSTYELLRYDDPNGEPTAQFVFWDGENSYFDEEEPGLYFYRVRYFYPPGSWYGHSDYAPNLNDPSIDYAMAVVTSVNENQSMVGFYPNPVSDVLNINGEIDNVIVFNALGQKVYEGRETSISTKTWNDGVYFLQIALPNGEVLTRKVLKK